MRELEKDRPSQDEGERQGQQRQWYRHPLVLIALAVVILAAIAGAVIWWLEARHWESTDDAFIDAHLVRVATQVAGRVARVSVDDNQDVAPGQVMLDLDPADFQATLDQASAARASAAGKLAQAQAQREVDAANLEEAQAEIGVAQASATNTERDLRRLQALAASRSPALSQQQLDTASAESAAANLIAAQKKAATARAQLGLADSQITIAAADLKTAEAQLEQAKLNLSYTMLAAPVAGNVTHRNVSPGDYVQIGQNLMALVPHEIWVTANFKETQLDLMRPGQPVTISVDAYPGKIFHGHLDSIQRGSGAAFSLLPPENATGNYVKIVQRVPVKIVFDDAFDPHYVLGPGMSVVPDVRVR